MSRGPWYREGLRFECTRCGACCSGFAGTVRVTDEEIAVLARRLGLSEAEFRKGYTRSVGADHLSLQETEEFDCVFYDRSKGCQVYEDRPKQCRTWPFWDRVVRTPATWETEAETCPGMNDGPLVDADTIRRLSDDDGTLLSFFSDGPGEGDSLTAESPAVESRAVEPPAAELPTVESPEI